MNLNVNNQENIRINSNVHSITVRNKHHVHRPNANLLRFQKSTFLLSSKFSTIYHIVSQVLRMNFWCLSFYSQMTHIRVLQWALSNCRKTHKEVANDTSTLEAFLSGLLHGVRMAPLQPLPTPTTLIYMSTHCNWAVISAAWHSSTHIACFCLSHPLESSVGCVSTMAYKTSMT